MKVKGPEVTPPSSASQPTPKPSLQAMQYSVLASAIELENQVMESQAPEMALSSASSEMTQTEYGLYAISLLSRMTSCLRSHFVNDWPPLKEELDRIKPFCDPTIQAFIDHPMQSPNLQAVLNWMDENIDEIMQTISNPSSTQASEICMDFFLYLTEGMNSPDADAFHDEWTGSEGGGISLLNTMPEFVFSYYYQKYMPQDPEEFKKQITIFYNSIPQDPSSPYASVRSHFESDMNDFLKNSPPTWPGQEGGWMDPAIYIQQGLRAFYEYLDRRK